MDPFWKRQKFVCLHRIVAPLPGRVTPYDPVAPVLLDGLEIDGRSMTSELELRRKWTLRAHGEQVVFVKKPIEHTHHVLMKAFLWALYLPEYPQIKVEYAIGDRYKPDVIALHPSDPQAGPLFWGEAGQVSENKIRSLVRRYRHTHFAIAKWKTGLHHVQANVEAALKGIRLQAPIDLLIFPEESADLFLRDDGQIEVTHSDLSWVRLT